jgi:hypothetical protein
MYNCNCITLITLHVIKNLLAHVVRNGSNLRNRGRQKPNIQQRHKRTTGETAGVTICRIRPQINTSHTTGISAI